MAEAAEEEEVEVVEPRQLALLTQVQVILELFSTTLFFSKFSPLSGTSSNENSTLDPQLELDLSEAGLDPDLEEAVRRYCIELFPLEIKFSKNVDR